MSLNRNVPGLLLWLAASMAAGWIGSRFMPGEWYDSLIKPEWNPPDAVFAPVWTALYITMGIAAWLVWREKGFSEATTPLALFIIQLALNALWSYLFFGIHQPMLAFCEIMVLWLMILLTTVTFWKVSVTAGVLLLPYLLWVSFASALNFQLWRLNIQ
ncbi:MAG TPA: TspO/MBR family protein [Candidatus Krumholzibacterium sp.]|nr:TspO/MBR family protein [Candidatus Krumholzibacterium sp.]